MLDIKFIRQYPEKVKESCQKKQVKVDIDKMLEIDRQYRENIKALEEMSAKKNKSSRRISEAKDEKEKQKIILKMKELDKNSDRLNKTFKELEKKFNNLIYRIPNLALDDVPIGKDEKDNVVLKKVGEKPKFDFKPKDYLTIAEKLDLIDIKRAAKVSGTRFGYLKREAVSLEFALINLAFDALLKEDFIPILPPVIIKKEMAKEMGYIEQLDKEEAYFLEKDKLILAGTAEQSIGPYFANEILEEKDLPKRFIGFSTCFRREAGSYGKDTRGIFRVHQFDKLEMFSFCKPEDSIKEHQFFLEMEEKLMQKIKLPYRVLQICTGDLARPSAATFDIESWLPSENRYRETHSTSNCTDFQARGLNIKYRNKSGQLNFVHTVNGTVFAIGRTLIAIIENYQQKDGSIKVPEILQKYMNLKMIK